MVETYDNSRKTRQQSEDMTLLERYDTTVVERSGNSRKTGRTSSKEMASTVEKYGANGRTIRRQPSNIRQWSNDTAQTVEGSHANRRQIRFQRLKRKQQRYNANRRKIGANDRKIRRQPSKCIKIVERYDNV